MRACRQAGLCATGDAILTKGFNLPADWVIHTVAPMYTGDGQDERLLQQCYFNCLMLAPHNNIETIAFPAIGIGGRRFPVAKAAEVAVRSIAPLLMKIYSITGVLIVCPNDGVKQIYDQAIYALTGR